MLFIETFRESVESSRERERRTEWEGGKKRERERKGRIEGGKNRGREREGRNKRERSQHGHGEQS